MKVVPFSGQSKLTEIYQTVDLKFSFLNRLGDEEWQEMTQPAKCRDYLHDIVNCCLNGSSFKLYGMGFDGKSTPISLDKFRMLLRFPNAEAFALFQQNISSLNALEEKNGIEKSVFYPVENLEDAIICEGDAFWLNNSVLISFYTFELRLMCYKDCVPFSGQDKDYLAHLNATEYYKNIRNNLKSLLSNAFHGWNGEDQYQVHDCSGLLSMFTKQYRPSSMYKNNTIFKDYVDRGLVCVK